MVSEVGMNSRAKLLHPRDELMEMMSRIYRYRMTTTSGGNLSIRDANGDVWITPSRVDKGSLRRDDIVCVRINGTTEGCGGPVSSDRLFGFLSEKDYSVVVVEAVGM